MDAIIFSVTLKFKCCGYADKIIYSMFGNFFNYGKMCNICQQDSNLLTLATDKTHFDLEKLKILPFYLTCW